MPNMITDHPLTSPCTPSSSLRAAPIYPRRYTNASICFFATKVRCNKSAVLQCTQRVRKAIKFGVDIINVEWLHQCLETGKRVDYTPFLLTELAATAAARHNNQQDKGGSDKKKDSNDEDIVVDPDAGWTEAVSLDCCCVCHENGDLNCPWCKTCNITLARQISSRSSDSTSKIVGSI